MDSNRFDRISRALALRTSRRGSLRTAGQIGGAVALAGLASTRIATAQDAESVCSIVFEAGIRVGPNAERDFGEGELGALAGTLTLPISDSGRLTDIELTLSDGTVLAGSGQATGQAITVRFDIPLTGTLVLVGAGEKSIKSCDGRFDGFLTGPQPGDLGDWHATATGKIGGDVSPTPIQDDESPGSSGDGGSAGPLPTVEPGPTCLEPDEPCQADEECCSRMCRSGTCLKCVGAGQSACPDSSYCCEGLVCGAMVCWIPDGQPCTSNDQCMRDCYNGVCGDAPTPIPTPNCTQLLEPCTDSSECCQGKCVTEGNQRICGLV